MTGTPTTFPSPQRRERLGSALAFGCLFLFYAWRCSPIPGPTGDNAEFQYLGHVFGISHPTGYPTYLLLNGVWTHLLPWGTLAWRANLFSALCATCACAILAASARRLGASHGAALSSALTIGLTGSFFRLAKVAEVYTLHACFVALILYAFLRWDPSREDRWLFAGCGFLAFSFGNHLTTVLLLPVCILWILWRAPKTFARPRVYLGVAALVILAAAQYAYLMVRSRSGVLFNYTSLNTPAEVWAYVTGQQFSEAKSFPGIMGMLRSGWALARELAPELLLPGVLALAGWVILFRTHRRIWVLSICLAAVFKLFILSYQIPDIADYILPVYILVGLWMAVGWGSLPSSRWKSAALALLPVMYAGAALLRPQWEGDGVNSSLADYFRTDPSGMLVTRSWRDSNLARYYAYGTANLPGAVHVSEFSEAHLTGEWMKTFQTWKQDGQDVVALPDDTLRSYLEDHGVVMDPAGLPPPLVRLTLPPTPGEQP